MQEKFSKTRFSVGMQLRIAKDGIGRDKFTQDFILKELMAGNVKVDGKFLIWTNHQIMAEIESFDSNSIEKVPVYKLKHKPTGLFYTPVKGYGDNLVSKGKLYATKPNLERGQWDTIKIRIKSSGWDNNKLTKKEKLICDYFKVNRDERLGYYGRYYFDIPREDWEIVEV